MNKPVYFHVSLNIHEGKADAFRTLAGEMTATTKNESGALAYEWYFSADGKRCRLVETYADEAAVMAHIGGKAVQEFVPKLLETAALTGFEVYGDPGKQATEILTKLGAELFQHADGIAR
jgi:quinol monooxygenase YgiN